MSWLVYYWWTSENIGYVIDLLSKLLKKLRCVSWMNFQGVAFFPMNLGIMKKIACAINCPVGKWVDVDCPPTVEQWRKGPWLFRLQKGCFMPLFVIIGFKNIPLQEFRIPNKQPGFNGNKWRFLFVAQEATIRSFQRKKRYLPSGVLKMSFLFRARGLLAAAVAVSFGESIDIHGNCRTLPNWICSDLGPQKCSFLEGKSLAISGKSRLVKYYSIWQGWWKKST